MAQETFNILIQGEPKGSLKYIVHTKNKLFSYFNNERRAGYLKSNVLLFPACRFISLNALKDRDLRDLVKGKYAKLINVFFTQRKLTNLF